MRKSVSIIFLFIFQVTFAQNFKSNWTGDGITVGTGLATGIILYSLPLNASNSTEDEILALNKNSLNFLDITATENYSPTISKISDYLVSALASAPLALFLSDNLSGERSTFALMYGENLMFAFMAPSIPKQTMSRYRPFAYNPDAPMEKKLKPDTKKSFFSGHTTVAFASSVFLASVYERIYPNSSYKELVWGASLISAGTVGLLRFYAGKHFPTDILAGAAVGSAIGYLVPYFHRNKNSAEVLPQQIQYVPIITFKFQM
jgi:membrane-associated phospholipid phosphatase